MSVFGFIENFFFISLALVFALVLFLVYHFKNRISVAEKKSESMYGLLTAVVKEIKTLRGMFGLGNAPEKEEDKEEKKPEVAFEIKSKTLPEVTSPSPKLDNSFATFVQREVINLDISASEEKTDKIVVSDVDSSDDSEDSYESYESDESDTESDDESNTEDAVLELSDIIDVTSPIVSIVNPEPDLVEVLGQDLETGENIFAELVQESVQEVEEESSVPVVSDVVEKDQTQEQEPKASETTIFNNRPSIDQLRKMNINQLKTIAVQHGISADISKMKKPELISLINESHVA
jgi:hypothetical protein